MNYTYFFMLLFLLVFGFGILFLSCDSTRTKLVPMHEKYETNKSIEKLLGISDKNIEKIVKETINQTNSDLEKIENRPDKERTFENTARYLDYTIGKIKIQIDILYSLSLVSPDDKIRKLSQEGALQLQNFLIDRYSQNRKIYEALLYLQKTIFNELADDEKYFLKETIDDLKRYGLEKDQKTQERIKELNKELSKHSIQFEYNIASDARKIFVNLDDLKGLDKTFVDQLKRTDDGRYILGVDYPTLYRVLQDCEIESTRNALWKEFFLRAYPINEEILNKVILLRNEVAHLLDFENYSQLDLYNQMAKSPMIVEPFLKELSQNCKSKLRKEIEFLKENLPKDITLVDGKFKPWDLKFIKEKIKREKYSLDENLVSQYFPMDNTIAQLFKIYEQFFGITFKKNTGLHLWHDDLRSFRVYKDDRFLGTLILDLFPRPNKFTHASQSALVPSIKTKNGDFYPAVILVIANFPKPLNEIPSLLKRKDVITFFHECGHAIHSLLGTTSLMSQAGTSVKTDFVEMPSQMLENWMWDRDILKMISSHYETGKPLPDELIDKILELKNFDSGGWLADQVFYSIFSLDLFKNKLDSDIFQFWKKLHSEIINYIYFDENNKYYCSFVHLMGYGPKYYGYLWSKVYAEDLFEVIKKYGLLNPKIGKKYVEDIISKGGSADPNKLLVNFLGRKPNSKAFFKDLGCHTI